MALPVKYKLVQEPYTDGFYREFEDALDRLRVGTTCVTVCGTSYSKKIANSFVENVQKFKLLPPIEIEKATAPATLKVQNAAEKENAPVIGFGGGKIIDVAKKGGSDANKPVIVVPTQPSHDGMASPVVSISVRTVPYSVSSNPPLGVILPMGILYESPIDAVRQGVCDSLSKIFTANLDWKLSAELEISKQKQKDPAFDEHISDLCVIPTLKIYESIKNMKEEGPFSIDHPSYKQFVSDLTDALFTYGIGMCTKNSSVCASGAEHLWGHGLDCIAEKYIPHGIGVGSGSIIAYNLYKKFKPNYLKNIPKNSNNLKEVADYIGIPYQAKKLGISTGEAIETFLKAYEIGVGRGRITIFDYIKEEYNGPRLEINEKFAKQYLTEIGFI